jgi:Holliday junction DNA helicase RuvA
MITHIQGKLVEKTPTHIIVDCNGIGYFINISLHTFSQLPNQEAVKVFTHLQVKEDSHTLYGFLSSSERGIFRLLISVSGIGASTARTMLSSLTPKQVKEGIAVGDVALIQSVNRFSPGASDESHTRKRSVSFPPSWNRWTDLHAASRVAFCCWIPHSGG